jgi:hypothetical protein
MEMARKLRVQHPGAIHHVMGRGNRRERILLDDQDRRKFLQTLGEACQKTGWQAHAYCFMNKTAWVGPKGVEAPAQSRSGQGASGEAVAQGNNHELAMNRRLSDDRRGGLRRRTCPRVAEAIVRSF